MNAWHQAARTDACKFLKKPGTLVAPLAMQTGFVIPYPHLGFLVFQKF
jgi:hypothetical protein